MRPSMVVFVFLGWIFILAALCLLGLGLWLWLSGQDITQQLGQLWFGLDSFSLNLAQVVVQRHLRIPALWDDGIVPYLLLQPAWESILWVFIGLLIVGGLLTLLGSRRKKRRSSFRND